MKFYTEEGNWDVVGNNTPVFFIRDPLKFPDFIHTQKRDPWTNLKSPQMMWDFWSHSPEALHQVTILFSDRGIPDGYRFMHGFGSHTFSLVNSEGERHWVKFHFKSMQGIRNLHPSEAARLAGSDPDYAQRDLFHAIGRGEFPRWKLCIQVMSEAEAASRAENPFDVTKVWSQKEFPLIEVGMVELNRNPQNYFAEVEQAAFAPSNVVPGIGLSPDRMLQGGYSLTPMPIATASAPTISSFRSMRRVARSTTISVMARCVLMATVVRRPTTSRTATATPPSRQRSTPNRRLRSPVRLTDMTTGPMTTISVRRELCSV